MFSRSNANFTPIDIDFSSHPVFIRQEELELEAIPPPQRLTRQTNEWSLYYGTYPSYCAMITNEAEIEMRKERDQSIVCLQIDRRDSRMMRREVVKNICTVLARLESIGLPWEKKLNEIRIGQTTLRMFVCDDSGLFHVIAEGNVNLQNLFHDM